MSAPEHSFSHGYISRRSFGAAELSTGRLAEAPNGNGTTATSTAAAGGGAVSRAASNRSQALTKAHLYPDYDRRLKQTDHFHPNRFPFSRFYWETRPAPRRQRRGKSSPPQQPHTAPLRRFLLPLAQKEHGGATRDNASISVQQSHSRRPQALLWMPLPHLSACDWLISLSSRLMSLSLFFTVMMSFPPTRPRPITSRNQRQSLGFGF